MIGQTVSHYKILEKIGSKDIGTVYKVKDLKLDRMIAPKFLPPDLSHADQAKQRYFHEIKTAPLLDHHNICTID